MNFLRIFLRWRLSQEEYNALFPKVFELAYFLLEDREAARDVTVEALVLLPLRWTIRWQPKREQILQSLIYESASRREIRRSSDDYLRYYLKHIVHLCLLRSSFDACISLGFIYELGGSESISFFRYLAQRKDLTDLAPYASLRKKQIHGALRERFGSLLLEEDTTHSQEKYRFVCDKLASAARVRECLTQLAPWQIPGRSVDELHPKTEIETIRAAFLPIVHDHFFVAKMKRTPSLRIPKFYIPVKKDSDEP
jgi:hypothetical protein